MCEREREREMGTMLTETKTVVTLITYPDPSFLPSNVIPFSKLLTPTYYTEGGREAMTGHIARRGVGTWEQRGK